MKPGILFLLDNIGDLPDFEGHKSEWQALAAANTEHALQALTDDYAAVVADAKFETNNESPFFERVHNRTPNIVRITLCSPSTKTPVATSATAHQYLDKPCTAEEVISAVERAERVQKWLKKSSIANLYGQMKKLPTVPSIYFRLVKALRSPDAEISDISGIIAEDLIMTAKVLQVVNSAAFGLGRNISNPLEAVSYLGIERTKALTVAAHALSNFTPPSDCPFAIDKLWHHSLATGNLAQMITREETGDVKMAEHAFIGGVLHDVGKLTLAVNLPDQYRAVQALAESSQIPFYEAEENILGASHSEIGACIMGAWGLPSEVVEAIGFHHHPEKYSAEGFSAATAIHLADVLEREVRGETEPFPTPLNSQHLAQAGIADRVSVWREIIGSPIAQTAA